MPAAHRYQRLSRSCATTRPDLKLICENILIARAVHHDWGLSTVKHVLRVAGGMKRDEPDKGEDELLMRALRDFNTLIFLRLIAELFTSLQAAHALVIPIGSPPDTSRS
eukprot:gene44919-55908_t